MDKPELRISYCGTKRWFLDGLLHRKDGPAIEYANGTKTCYLNCKFHREDGPAIEYPNGDKEWYLHGQKVTKAQAMRARK